MKHSLHAPHPRFLLPLQSFLSTGRGYLSNIAYPTVEPVRAISLNMLEVMSGAHLAHRLLTHTTPVLATGRCPCGSTAGTIPYPILSHGCFHFGRASKQPILVLKATGQGLRVGPGCLQAPEAGRTVWTPGLVWVGSWVNRGIRSYRGMTSIHHSSLVVRAETLHKTIYYTRVRR